MSFVRLRIGGYAVATDPEGLTVAEISDQLRDLVAQTHSLVAEIQTVVDTLHDYTQANRFERRTATTPHIPERRKNV